MLLKGYLYAVPLAEHETPDAPITATIWLCGNSKTKIALVNETGTLECLAALFTLSNIVTKF